jgi:hypothetical protein
VIGAVVSGLTSAICLAEADLTVAIQAAERGGTRSRKPASWLGVRV